MHAWRAPDFGGIALTRAGARCAAADARDRDARSTRRWARRCASDRRDVTRRCRTGCCSTPDVLDLSSCTRGAARRAAADLDADAAGRRRARRPRSRWPAAARGVAGYARDAATGRVRATRAAHRAADAGRLQRGRRRHVVRTQRGRPPSGTLSVGEIIARHQQQQRAQDALVAELHRPRAHGAALPADDRPIPATTCVTENRYFVAGDGRRVGGAVVLGERLEVGRRPAAVSAAAAGEGAVAAAAAAVRRRLPLPAGRHRARRRLRLLRRALRAGAQRQRALSRHGLDRSSRRSRASGCRRCRAGCRRRWCRTRRSSATRR